MTTPAELIPRFETLRNHAVAARNDLSNTYSALPLGDPRRVLARHLKAVISSSYLNLIFLDENLQSREWWVRQGFQAAIDLGSVQDELGDYLTLLTASVVVYPFSLFEAGLRRIVRAVDPDACAGGTASFKSVYEWLFARLRAEGWSFSVGDPNTFLDVYRNLRNTLHNNGLFYSANGTDSLVEWNGVQYEFRHAQHPPFVDWDFHLLALETLVDLNHEMMQQEPITSLPPIP